MYYLHIYTDRYAEILLLPTIRLVKAESLLLRKSNISTQKMFNFLKVQHTYNDHNYTYWF